MCILRFILWAIKSTKFQVLEKYAIDLTKAAREGKLDPVIGRDEEVRRVVQVLSRRTKNNPVLIGEPGVGKTGGVDADLSDLHKAGAAVALAALDLEAGLIIGVIGPTQVDLSLRCGRCRQITRSGWRRSRCRSRCWSRRWRWSWRRRWCR